MSEKKSLAILGSTGSIGTQALDIVRANSDLFDIVSLTAGSNADLLIEQALEFKPDTVVIANENLYSKVQQALQHLPIKVWAGSEAVADAAALPDVDLVLAALVGYSGLRPTLRALEAEKIVALANKESLVVAGKLVMQASARHRVPIIPVDSEHSAILQCMIGESQRPEKLILTASGGPFLHKSAEELKAVTPQQALAHPNWSMGAKVSIDSASLMNKGFEMIEARWLFDMQAHEIDILIHPQSIVHSMVQYADGSVKAQLGIPDMRLPIGYALGLGNRVANEYPRLDFLATPLSFEKPDMQRFPNLGYAFEAIRQDGNMPCALNAANEVAVEAFLQHRLAFVDMSGLIADTLAATEHIKEPTLDELIATDGESRRLASELLGKYS